jgi:hypothetical protein
MRALPGQWGEEGYCRNRSGRVGSQRSLQSSFLCVVACVAASGKTWWRHSDGLIVYNLMAICKPEFLHFF